MANEQLYYIGTKAIIQKDGKLLVLREVKDSGRTSYWGLPGGRIGKSEKPQATLKREVSEETGITDLLIERPLIMALSSVMKTNANAEEIGIVYWVYLCSTNTAQSDMIYERDTTGKWCSPKDAAELVSTNPNYPKEIVALILGL